MIKFDLDGVLIDIIDAVKLHLREKHCVEFLDNNKYRIETDPPLSQNKIWDCIELAYADYDHIHAYPYAAVAMKLAYDTTGKPVRIITARPIRAATETYTCIDKLFGNDIPKEIILTNGYKDKIHHLEPGDIFVEDRLESAEWLAAHGVNVFLIDRSYNQKDGEDEERVVRIQKLKHILPFLSGRL